MYTCRHKSKTSWQSVVGAVVTFVSIALGAFALAALPSFADDTGSLELDAKSQFPAISDDNKSYALEDARFGIYRDYQCTDRAGELITDEHGHAASQMLDAGRYFIRQEQASPGFAISDQLYQADVAIGKTAHVDASACPNYSAPGMLLREINAETGNQAGVAGAQLGEATYTVSYYDSTSEGSVLSGASRTWTFVSDSNGEVHLSDEYLKEGSPLYKGPQDTPVLPVGHYVVHAEKAPAGFVFSEAVLEADIIDATSDEIDPICSFDPFESQLDTIRGDIMFRKIDENGNALSGIPFLISYANGESAENDESHVIVTDEHGDATTSASRVVHSDNTNASDAAVVACLDGVYMLDESKLVDNTGIWFSQDNTGQRCNPDDTKGALPYGSYLLQELPCAANAGMNLVTTEFSIHRDGYMVALDDIVDTVPAIESEARDAQDLDQLIRPAQGVTIFDTVRYRNLIAGKTYSLTTTALVSETGEYVPGTAGTPAIASCEFIAQGSTGKVEVELDLDASKLAGKHVLVCDELTSQDGMSIVPHTADDSSRLLEVEPIIIATAQDAHDYDEYVMGSDAAILESIAYEGLVAGQPYTASIVLNDKATGNTLRDAQGNVVTATETFTPESSNGQLDIEIGVDATGIAGHDIVAFDKMTDGAGKTIAHHQDFEDASQTVKTVKLSSMAVDKTDGDKMFDAASSNVTIVDTVKYANLVPGEQYEFEGVLMDKETGTALTIDGNPVRASVPFVPEEVSGSADVEYSFDASKQTSEVLVAFETLEHEGNVIAEHADIEDVAQTVTSEDIDPDAAASADQNEGTAISAISGKGAMAKTGDVWPRALGCALLMIAGTVSCIAYASHRRRRTLEAIARSSEIEK